MVLFVMANLVFLSGFRFPNVDFFSDPGSKLFKMVSESFQSYELEIFFLGFGVGFIVTTVVTFIILITWWCITSRRQAAEELAMNRELFRRRRERQQG